VKIAETERLVIREMDSEKDAEFIFSLLNSPKFIKYIGDRGVASAEQARGFIETRYRQSYLDNGFGLYTVKQKEDNVQVGICGFVKRAAFDHPDIGFAFLPDHEGKGYGYESASAMMGYGRDTLGFTRVLAITTRDNEASGKLLTKLGFSLDGPHQMPDGEVLNLYSAG
jgi:RimJ/RimL family protein N-acetyltransferase